MAPKSYEELADQVAGNGDLAVFDMGVLRDLQGAGKLGKYVREEISQSLHAHGLGHFPEELPIYQHEVIRVYRSNSAVGRVIEAVLHPNPKGDAALRSVADDEDHQKLEQIRKIVDA